MPSSSGSNEPVASATAPAVVLLSCGICVGLLCLGCERDSPSALHYRIVVGVEFLLDVGQHTVKRRVHQGLRHDLETILSAELPCGLEQPAVLFGLLAVLLHHDQRGVAHQIEPAVKVGLECWGDGGPGHYRDRNSTRPNST